MVAIVPYEKAMAAVTGSKKRHLLLGNGFSIALKPDIFSYGSLYENADFGTASHVKKLFEALKTQDFEIVIKYLQDAAKVVEVYRPSAVTLARSLRRDAAAIKDALVTAIAKRHPDRPFDIKPSQYAACRKFVSPFDHIRASQTELGKRVDERGMAAGRAEAPAPIDLALFTASLKMAWEAGEQRPTHRRRYVRVKPIVRSSMLDAVRDQLLTWLEAQPALTAVAALDRLRALDPDRFTADHLRTVQRFIKVRRLTMAREVLLGPLPPSAALASDAIGFGDAERARGDTKSPCNIPP